jgi:hypothetical protein
VSGCGGGRRKRKRELTSSDTVNSPDMDFEDGLDVVAQGIELNLGRWSEEWESGEGGRDGHGVAVNVVGGGEGGMVVVRDDPGGIRLWAGRR